MNVRPLVAEPIRQARKQIIIIAGGEINRSKTRIAILIQEIAIQGRHGKAILEVPGTNRIQGTPPEAMIPDEAAVVPIQAGIAADPVQVHPVQVQDHRAAGIN